MDIEKEMQQLKAEFENLKINYTTKKTINISEEKINLLENFKNCIYIIEGKVNDISILNKYYEKLAKDYKMPQLNNIKDYGCIYIGSSGNNSIKKRLKHHFISKNCKSTYSLHLGANNNYSKNFSDLKIQLIKFDCDLNIVKYFESKLHKKLKPLFGQRCIR